MAERRIHPRVRRQIVSDGTEYGVGAPIGEPGERAFRAGVALTNELYDVACRIADAFLLGCTEPYMSEAMRDLLPHGWSGVAIELAKGLARDAGWIVAGAGIGATFGAVVGSIFPPAEIFTVAGGAALGVTIATWALIGIGIVTAVKAVLQLTNAIALLLSEACRLAVAGDQHRAAQLFARAIGIIFAGIVPMVIIALLTRAGGRALQANTTKYMLGRIATRIQASEIRTVAQAKLVGLTGVEFEAIATATRRTFQVFRGCNPNRVDAIERNGGLAAVHFKPGYFKDFKSLRTGRSGEYAVEASEFEAYIRRHYRLEREGGMIRVKATRDSRSNSPYLDRTSPVSRVRDRKADKWDDRGDNWGPWLDNHLLEETVIDGVRYYAMKHPDGKPFVPDIDRLMYAEIKENGLLGKSGVVNGRKWLANDDPREVMYWNQRISQAISRITGKPIDWRGMQHGKSADFHMKHKVTGEVGPGWPKRNTDGVYLIENEPIVIGIDGRLFVTDWSGLATYMKSIELLRLKYPWARALISDARH